MTDQYSHFESIVVDRPAELVYDLVSDITRMGGWSPVCASCWWGEGSSATVGGRFTGRNEMDGRSWETSCEIVVADPGVEFAFLVGGNQVRWGYTLEAEGDGTRVTESWQLLEAGREVFRAKYGAEADHVMGVRRETALAGIPVTLAGIKRTAEELSTTL